MAVIEDQAADLRKAAESRNKTVRRLRCISVASGKGGVGKTVVSIGLGLSLARLGHKVLLFDADMGLANVDIQLGVDPRMTVQDVILGGAEFPEAVINVRNNLDLLPSSSGAVEMADMGSARRSMFVDDLLQFAGNYDYLIIDVGAGIGQSITTFLQSSPEVLIVVANEPTSIMDAYSLIKILAGAEAQPQVNIVVNMVRHLEEGEHLYKKLDAIVKKFLNNSYPCVGVIPYDFTVGNSIRARRPVLEYAPGSAASICLREMAQEVVESGRSSRHHGDVRRLFDRLAGNGISKGEGGNS